MSLCFDAFLAPNDTSIELSVTIARRNVHSLLLGLCSMPFLGHPKGLQLFATSQLQNKANNALLSFQQNTCRTAKLFLSKRGGLDCRVLPLNWSWGLWYERFWPVSWINRKILLTHQLCDLLISTADNIQLYTSTFPLKIWFSPPGPDP